MLQHPGYFLPHPDGTGDFVPVGEQKIALPQGKDVFLGG